MDFRDFLKQGTEVPAEAEVETPETPAVEETPEETPEPEAGSEETTED